MAFDGVAPQPVSGVVTPISGSDAGGYRMGLSGAPVVLKALDAATGELAIAMQGPVGSTLRVGSQSITVEQSGISVNAFRRRETSTVVEMRDGESFAIAGLLQDDFEDLNSQVPWLGDVPVLGSLFRSASYQRSQSELVIIITPHLVTPTRGDALALPTDRIRPPTESELFLFGKTAGNPNGPTPGPAGEVSQQDFDGSYGYVME